ncbi:MAG: hypothetical protein LIO58_01025 [Oscillospiraceae bacterium]|nr:hypothetical protein [Oscillospiraceae bacterium]
MEELFAPLGDYAPKVRIFAVDYHDKAGQDRYQVYAMAAPDGVPDDVLVHELSRPLREGGNIISGITELLDGYSLDELEAMAARCSLRACRCSSDSATCFFGTTRIQSNGILAIMEPSGLMCRMSTASGCFSLRRFTIAMLHVSAAVMVKKFSPFTWS